MEALWDRVSTVIGTILLLGFVLAICIQYPVMWVPAVVGGYWLYQIDITESRKRKEEQYDRGTCAANLEKAKAGDSLAMIEYGRMVLRGQGCAKDEKVGMAWFDAASRKREPNALYVLGQMHLSGELGQLSDRAQALRFFSEARQLGHPDAGREARQIVKEDDLMKSILAEDAADTESRSNSRQRTTTLPIASESSRSPEFAVYFGKCASEPERHLLRALISAADLRPDGAKLIGKISVEQQARVLNFRIDFLVDGFLAVEVDGKSYHGDDGSFERDRVRDQTLILNGFVPIRFPASQVFRGNSECATKVLRAAKGQKSTPHIRRK